MERFHSAGDLLGRLLLAAIFLLAGLNKIGGYEGTAGGHPVAVNHLDLYRLEGLEERDALEIDDYLDPAAITFVEWAEPALGLMQNPTVVSIAHETPTTRRVRLTGPAAEGLSGC